MEFYEKNEKSTEVKKKEDVKKFNSDHHTLYKTVVPAKQEVIDADNNTFKNIDSYSKYRMFVDSFMEFGNKLHDVYNELWNAKEKDELELRINSRGGLVNEGAQFYSIIKNKFNGRCTTVLDNCGYSMGALTFCMGDKRVITERADLMFHDYSGGAAGKGGEIESRNKHTQVHIRKFFGEVILNQGFLTKKEYNNMLIGQDFWMGAEELCKRGIATHVLYNGEEIKAKKYLKIIKSK